MAIITTATVKTLLGISSTSEDSKLDLLVGYADAAIKRYLGRDIESTSYPGAASNGHGDSGIYCGTGTRFIVLRQRPVTAVASVYLDNVAYYGQATGAFASATLLTEGTDYAWVKDGYISSASVSFCGAIERIAGVWPRPAWYRPGYLISDPQTAQGNIKVTYTAGWATVPGDIAQAAAWLVSYWRQSQKRGGTVTSENLGGYSYSLAAAGEAGWPAEVRKLLSPYREARFG